MRWIIKPWIDHAFTNNIRGRIPEQKREKRLFLQRSISNRGVFEVMLSFNFETQPQKLSS